MTIFQEIVIAGLVATVTLVSVSTVLLRNLLRELRERDSTTHKLRKLCAEYRSTITRLEAERNLLRDPNSGGDFRYFSPPDRPEHWQSPPGPATTQS